LQAADAMLGADRAVEAAGEVVDDVVELGPALEELGRIGAGRLAQVVMDVAVADVTEGEGTYAGQLGGDGGGRAGDEVGDATDRHRDIVLDAAALIFLAFDHGLADAPELARLRRAGGNDAVFYQVAGQRLRQELLERAAQPAIALTRRYFEQRIP